MLEEAVWTLQISWSKAIGLHWSRLGGTGELRSVTLSSADGLLIPVIDAQHPSWQQSLNLRHKDQKSVVHNASMDTG